MRRRSLVAGVFAALALCYGLAAAETSTYLQEYRAYNEALQNNDEARAREHAYKAWQAAENALGDHRLTAILAFNRGYMELLVDNRAARSAFDRAARLQVLAADDVSASELHIYQAYLELDARRSNRNLAKVLRDALKNAHVDGVADSNVIAAIWTELANIDLAEGRHGSAIDCAEHAEAMLNRLDDGDYRSLAKALLINGAARLVGDPDDVSASMAAHVEFQRARKLFPQQKSLASFDAVLAKVIAWDVAANAAARTAGYDDFPAHRHGNSDKHADDKTLFVRDVEGNGCGSIQWGLRTPPVYPEDALRDASLGAVLVGFNIAEDLSVEDVSILAEVPARQFGDTVLDAVSGWRVRAMSNDSAECRANQLAKITFAMDF